MQNDSSPTIKGFKVRAVQWNEDAVSRFSA